MNDLTIKCYADRDECGYCREGYCAVYDRPCEEIHVNLIREDGEE